MSVPRMKTVTRQDHDYDCPAYLDNDEECFCFYREEPRTITVKVCACCGDELRRPCQRALSPVWNPDAAFMVNPTVPTLGDNEHKHRSQ